MTTAPRTVDWRWRHGPVSGPLHASLALLAAQQLGTLPVVDARPGIVLGGGLTAAGIVALGSKYNGMSWGKLTYRLTAMSSASVWLAQAITDGWTAPLGWTLAGGAIMAGLLWRPMHHREQLLAERRAAAETAAQEAAVDAAAQEQLFGLAWEWIRRIEKVCRVTLLGPAPTREDVAAVVPKIEHWMFPGPDGQDRCTGYTVELVLPTTGETWQTIANFQDGLAAAADLPEGCGVEVGPGASRRRALIEVSTYDALRDDIPLPVPAAPRRASDPVRLGVLRNGAAAEVPLLYESMVLAGAKRSGKSNELQTLIAELLSCDDRLILVIDYNGGGVALPWLAPWVDGTIDDSPILWVADNPDEALVMCDWLIAQIEHRKRAYYAENTARNDDKVAPSARVPQLMLVTDEFGSLSRQVKDKIAQISDRGGAAAVSTLSCTLRALADYIPTEMIAQAQVRAAMRVNDVKELGYLFESQRGVSAQDAPHVGYGHFRVGQEPPKVFKGYRTAPATIREVAVAQAAWRPKLDAVSAAISPDWQRVFAARWDRSAHLLAAAGGRPAAPVPDRPAPSGAVPDRPGASGADGPAAALGGVFDELDAAAEKLRDAVNSQGRRGGDDDEFDQIVTAFDVVPELLVRALVAFRGAERMHSASLAGALGVPVARLGQLLSQVDVRPLPSDFKVGGKRGRGYRRADLEAAVDRIRRGELVPPESVTEWRPALPPEWS